MKVYIPDVHVTDLLHNRTAATIAMVTCGLVLNDSAPYGTYKLSASLGDGELRESQMYIHTHHFIYTRISEAPHGECT
jgi:hypothetical protein